MNIQKIIQKQLVSGIKKSIVASLPVRKIDILFLCICEFIARILDSYIIFFYAISSVAHWLIAADIGPYNCIRKMPKMLMLDPSKYHHGTEMCNYALSVAWMYITHDYSVFGSVFIIKWYFYYIMSYAIIVLYNIKMHYAKFNFTSPTTKIESSYECNACRITKTNMNRCSRCKSVYYCSRKCQVDDWSEHKKLCIPCS